MRTTTATLALLAALSLAALGCADGGDTATEQRGPHDPQVQMDTDQIVVEPTEAQPGDTLEVHFPEEMSRGVHLVLERESDGDWHHAYDIATDVHHDGAPRVYEAGDDDFGIDDIDVDGPGPDPVPVPDDAPTGDYRVCTGNAVDNVCAPVTLRSND